MTLQILQGDCVELLKQIPDRSIHCCVTSPPYGNLRTYGGFTWDFKGLAAQLFRVLCDGGVLCWNVGDEVLNGSETFAPFRQAIHFRDAVGFAAHDTMIYQKLNFSHPERSRYHQVFEYVFIFSKGTPRVWHPIIDRQNKTAGKVGNFGRNTFTLRDGSKSERSKKVVRPLGMRHNVWLGKTAGQENVCRKLKFPAMMPLWLANDLIQSWSDPGDVILDPMAGSGTTGLAALKLERRAILCEMNPDYIPQIEARCKFSERVKIVSKSCQNRVK